MQARTNMATTKDMTGALFRNRNKTGPKDPIYTGNLCINGVEYQLACWIKEASAKATEPGMKYLRVAARPSPAPEHSERTAAHPDNTPSPDRPHRGIAPGQFPDRGRF
jgi:hypothetical protein